jgi:hypothetical protein
MVDGLQIKGWGSGSFETRLRLFRTGVRVTYENEIELGIFVSFWVGIKQ